MREVSYTRDARSRMSEKDLEKLFREEVKKAGGLAYKFVSPGTSGVPDRLVVFPTGVSGFVEVKVKGKKPRPDQEYQINKLKSMGHMVFVLDNKDQIAGIIKQLKSQGGRA